MSHLVLTWYMNKQKKTKKRRVKKEFTDKAKGGQKER